MKQNIASLIIKIDYQKFYIYWYLVSEYEMYLHLARYEDGYKMLAKALITRHSLKSLK